MIRELCLHTPVHASKMDAPNGSPAIPNYTDEPKSQDSQNVTQNNISTIKECPSPLMLSVGQGALLESAVTTVNKTLWIVIDIIIFPFTCLILFVHHLISLWRR